MKKNEKTEELMEFAVKITEEDEMEIFRQAQKTYPFLDKYGEKVAEQFFNHYRLLIDLVITAHDGKLYPHSFVINGAILRSLNFYRGALWALGSMNVHVFFDCLRAQCETLALIHYCAKYPQYVVAATIGDRKHPDDSLKIKNVLTLVDKADKEYGGLREDYNSLCGLVHPNPESLYAMIQPLTETEKGTLLIRVSTKSPRLTEENVAKDMKILIAWTDWIFKELDALSGYFKKEVGK